MKLEQLKHIIEIDKQKSISKAARVLYVGLSTLSNSLTSLEDELGVKLFERTTGGVAPTNEGKEVLQLAHKMLDIENQILHLGQKNIELRGTVTLLVGQAFGYFLKDIILEFKQRYPKADLILQVGTPHQIYYDLLKGTSNVVLAFLTEKQKEQILDMKKTLCIQSFGEYPFFVFTQKNGKYAEQSTITMDVLKSEQILLNSSEVWDILFPQISLEKNMLVVTDRDLLRQLIIDGEGVALLPGLFAKNALQSEVDTIKILTIDSFEPIPKGEALLFYPERKALTQLEQGLVSIVQETLQRLIKIY